MGNCLKVVPYIDVFRLKSWRYICSHLKHPILYQKKSFLLFASVCVSIAVLSSHSRDNNRKEFINTIFHRIISFHSCMSRSIPWFIEGRRKKQFFCWCLQENTFLLYYVG